MPTMKGIAKRMRGVFNPPPEKPVWQQAQEHTRKSCLALATAEMVKAGMGAPSDPPDDAFLACAECTLTILADYLNMAGYVELADQEEIARLAQQEYHKAHGTAHWMIVTQAAYLDFFTDDFTAPVDLRTWLKLTEINKEHTQRWENLRRSQLRAA